MAKVPQKEGFSFDPDELRKSSAKYREASQTIDGALRKTPPTIDAGSSSQVVGAGIEKLIRLAAGGGLRARDLADKIHATNGSYADVDNNAAGKIKLADDRPR